MGNLLRVAIVLAGVVAAAGSASAPGKHAVNKSSDVSHGREETWAALIDIFADRGWAIDNLEKDSGIITTDWMTLGDSDARYVDCGGAGIAAIKSTEIRFNVRVKGDDVVSTVTVNTKFRQERYMDGKTWSVDCSSRGIVESEIQNAVDSMAVRAATKTKKPKKAEVKIAPSAPRGFFCATSASTGFCVRTKAECARTRDVSLAALPDLTECALTERAWCLGERCFPSAEICGTRIGDAGVCAESE